MKKTSIFSLFFLLFTLAVAGLRAQDELSMATGQANYNGPKREAKAIDPEATVRAMLAAADNGDMEKFMSYWAPKFEVYFNGKLTSAEDMKKRVTVFKAGFPNVKRVIDEVTVSGNTVIVHGWMTGTNTGKFMDKDATGKTIKAHLLCIFKLNADGKIVSGTVDTDMDALKSQLK